MSRMSEFDAEMRRMVDLDMAVRQYLSHLYGFEQGVLEDGPGMEQWREQLELLTAGEPLEVDR